MTRPVSATSRARQPCGRLFATRAEMNRLSMIVATRSGGNSAALDSHQVIVSMTSPVTNAVPASRGSHEVSFGQSCERTVVCSIIASRTRLEAPPERRAFQTARFSSMWRHKARQEPKLPFDLSRCRVSLRSCSAAPRARSATANSLVAKWRKNVVYPISPLAVMSLIVICSIVISVSKSVSAERIAFRVRRMRRSCPIALLFDVIAGAPSFTWLPSIGIGLGPMRFLRSFRAFVTSVTIWFTGIATLHRLPHLASANVKDGKVACPRRLHIHLGKALVRSRGRLHAIALFDRGPVGKASMMVKMSPQNCWRGYRPACQFLDKLA